MKLTLGFSPCPNDTFIFDAMVNGKIDTRGLSFDYVMEDVETLNRWAEEGKLDITKLSYNAFLNTVDKYALLHSGSALGKGVGPLLVTKGQNSEGRDQKAAVLNPQSSIAIPGKNTTANLLLSLAFPEAKNKTEVLFSEIEQAVLDGQYDAGLIIHEGRFTYQQKGLAKIIDLGDWWENTMNAAIPLGGIVIKRDLGAELATTVDAVIKESLRYSWENYPSLSSFITQNAQEMQENVMRQHIDLYVNEYSEDLGEEGRKAVMTLFEQAKETGLIEQMPADIFY
ncbi:MAG TPA: 1,4-dihydroxy-6-naphthoate synthase [Flavipsychrobacter sp.]|nr:1,4-dihydroxy-6-naphthoate synthase [Flavipsychrobacter sp.]